jgi:hypothetical protein
MRPQILFWLSLTLVGAALSGCVQYPAGTGEKPVEEGVIYAVQYEINDGRTEGFTRLNDPKAVPGGNGKWNIDARGKLYHDFLMIRFAGTPGLSYQAIPIRRLFFVQFGDGGIKQVNSQSQSQ